MSEQLELKDLDKPTEKRGRPRGSKKKKVKEEFFADTDGQPNDLFDDNVMGGLFAENPKNDLVGNDNFAQLSLPPDVARRKDKITNLWLRDPKIVEMCIQRVVSGDSALDQLDMMDTKQLDIIQKMAKFEMNKSIDKTFIGKTVVGASSFVDKKFGLDGEFIEQIESDQEIQRCAEEIIGENYLVDMPPIARFGMLYFGHLMYASVKSKNKKLGVSTEIEK